MKYCGKCGEQNSDDDVFCWKCGNRLHSDSDSDVTARSSPEKDDSLSCTDERTNADSKLKIGYSMVDENHVMYYGKRYNISKENLHEYRTNGLICIVIAYVLGFYALFGSGFTYEMGYLGEQSRTLYEIIIGDGFDALFSNDVMTMLFIASLILIVLSIIPAFSIFGGLILCLMGSSVGTISHDIFGVTVGVDLVETNMIFWAVTIVQLIFGVFGAVCLSKYSTHIEMYEGKTWWDSFSGFITGRV